MGVFKIVVQAGLLLWDQYKIRKAKQKAHANSPRSSVLVQCVKCNQDVKADELSLWEHTRTCTPKA